MADPKAMEAATEALDSAIPDYRLAAPQDVLSQLRRENAQLQALAGEQADRANRAESALHQTTAAAAAEREQIVRAQAQQAPRPVSAPHAQVPQPRQVVAPVSFFIGQLVNFLVDRAPVLATLAGAYFLARDMLPTPGAMQLGLLGIYGAVAVAPAVTWSLRRK